MNGIEAMQPITDRTRELLIRLEQGDAQAVRISVTDCGVGFSADTVGRLFNTFSPLNPAAWAWDYRFAVRSSNFTGGASGLCPIELTAPPSSSRCLCIQQRLLTKKRRVKPRRESPGSGRQYI